VATEFVMPKLGLTMEEGTIVEWLVADGAEVAQGTPVLQIETDKVASDVEASASGVLHIIGEAEQTYACGERLGWFLEVGEEPPADQAGPVGSSPSSAAPAVAPGTVPPGAGGRAARGEGSRLLASPNARRVAAERGVDLAGIVGTGPGGRIVSEDVPVEAASRAAGTSVPPASAAARQLASLLGVDLAAVPPAGPEPRVVRADVARHVRALIHGRAPEPPPVDPPLLQTPTSTVPLTGMRGVIADRMHASLREMAQLTLNLDVVMDAVVRDRDRRGERGDEARPGYTDYVVAAVAGALRSHPIVNSQIHDGHVALLPDVNVGVAVALDGGLVVPVVRQADRLSVDELSAETTRLVAAARGGEASPDDLAGGTFSVTALGMFGVDGFTPVINPPNTAILGVGRLRDDIHWEGDVPTKAKVLTLSLTWDHRAYDGVPAAEFAADVRDRLQSWGSAR
jgi:pyruvate dehydrogenase E2 component (dihydrolipoamide acetyltransferase)